MALAPVLLFVYNRLDTLEKTLNSLKQNELAAQSELFIYSDGPKADANEEQVNRIKIVRDFIKKEKWCGKVNIMEREKNIGLATSVISGVTDLTNRYGKVIVVEDDALLSPYFLNYMNDSLDAYENNAKIFSIASWNYFASGIDTTNDHFFFRFPDSVSWATYKRSWQLFEKDAALALKKLQKTKKLDTFNGDKSVGYFENMLRMQAEGKISSWAIRWTATAVINDMLVVFPKISVAKNIGIGAADATHEKGEDYNADLELTKTKLKIVPKTEITENKIAVQKWVDFVKAHFDYEPRRPVTLAFRIKRKLKSILKLS